MRYHLAIHNITKCQLNSLDKIGRSYIKKWLNFPTRGVTDTVDCAMSSIGLDTVIDQTLALPISYSQTTVGHNVSNIETDQEEIVANNYLSSIQKINLLKPCLLYTSPSPRDS